MDRRRPRPLRSRPHSPIAEYLRRVAPAETADDLPPPAPPPKLYRVSEIARHFRLTRQTLHNYATMGLITERERTPGGQRLFDESVFRRVRRIVELKRRYRLQEIRHILETEEDPGPGPAAQAAGPSPERDPSDPLPPPRGHHPEGVPRP